MRGTASMDNWMSDQFFAPIKPARLSWSDAGPCSIEFGDHYYSRDDGIRESQYVFLDGNDLQARFHALPDHAEFVIGETGFGTGLNLLLAARLFLQQAPASCRLHFFSVEAHPLSAEDLRRAHGLWQTLEPECAQLQQHYPDPAPGFHRRWLFDGRVSLTLALGDATAMLGVANLQADAWFLDGFAPDRNESMWQAPLYQALARHSRPGATLATFTAAGHVRRGLSEAGFSITRRPGHGRKRHMLCGQANTGRWQPRTARPDDLVVAGAGLAGATCARALAERGHRVTVLDPMGIAGGASGNLAGVVYTSASGHATAQNRFYQASYLQALAWLRRYRFPGHPDQGQLNGVVQYPADQRHRVKARQALEAGWWPPASLQGDAATGALTFHAGGTISPPAWCQHLLDHPAIRLERTGLEAVEPGDTLLLSLANGEQRHCSQLVLANEARALALAGDLQVALKRIRGQVTQVAATQASTDWQQTLCHRGYLSTAINGQHCVGATFNLHHHDAAPRDQDDRDNLTDLAQYLPQQWRALGAEQIRITGRRVGFRCQSPDFLPLVGRTAPDSRIWLSVAHGSRGITGTTLAAELIAAQIHQEPCPVDCGILSALDPLRFRLRQQRKTRRIP